MIEVLKKEQQVYGEFNNGEIVENKPIGFPHEKGGFKAYSNIFYWAYASSKIKSTIGLHPHKGFEIMSYVIKGTIQHYDTLMQKWINLNEGDLQIIQSGSGISHSESINQNAAIFQIWFDPNIEKSINQKPTYKDYKANNFKSDGEKKVIIGNPSPVQIGSENISIFELELEKNYLIDNKLKKTISVYVLSGQIQIFKTKVTQHDFIKIQDEDNIKIEVISPTKLFCISSPQQPSYPTYIKYN
tara:strand:- start:58 stop:786 length:729 start_codon:yes stop_codon:yes gene_type:complete